MIKRRSRRSRRKSKPIEIWLLSFVSIVMLFAIIFSFMFDAGPRKTTGSKKNSGSEMTDPVQKGDGIDEAGVKSRDLESTPTGSNSGEGSTGLETDNVFFPLCIVLTGDFSGESTEREAIQTEVESLLRPTGIKFQITEQMDLDQSIEVRVQTFGNSFFVSIRFIRWIDYNATGKSHTIPVPVYSIGSLGTQGTGTRYLTDSVGENMTKFLNRFLQVNIK